MMHITVIKGGHIIRRVHIL